MKQYLHLTIVKTNFSFAFKHSYRVIHPLHLNIHMKSFSHYTITDTRLSQNIQRHKNSAHQTHNTSNAHQGTDIRGSPRPRGYVHQQLGFFSLFIN